MDDTAGKFIRADSEDALKGFAREVFGEERAVERLKAKDGVFTVGDFITVRGSLFKVEAIDEELLTLRLLPRT